MCVCVHTHKECDNINLLLSRVQLVWIQSLPSHSGCLKAKEPSLPCYLPTPHTIYIKKNKCVCVCVCVCVDKKFSEYADSTLIHSWEWSSALPYTLV